MSHRGPEARRDLSVAALARVEGEGAMRVRLANGHVEHISLNIYEPPRFFEAMLVGRHWHEPPDITARICGICPVAYQTSANEALESIAGVSIDGPLRVLRRLLYCGEWIQSHALHIFLLHAPDFLGYDSAVELAAVDRALVERGLGLRRVGRWVIETIGGRESHPVNVRVGGFYRAPTVGELEKLRGPLEKGLEDAAATVELVAGLDFPDLEIDHELVALHHPDEYAIDRGRIVSDAGLDIAPAEFGEHFVEEQVAHSTALHARRIGSDRSYLVGPLARYALNFDQLPKSARDAAIAAGLPRVVRNPYQSIVVRAVELLAAYDEALRLLDVYVEPERPFVDVVPTAGEGHGVSEAPRGLLYHRYVVGDDGLITAADIVPPTSQNQRAIEEDLADFVEAHINLDDDGLRHRCEQAIRNYDPCISCATHFLDLHVDRQ